MEDHELVVIDLASGSDCSSDTDRGHVKLIVYEI